MRRFLVALPCLLMLLAPVAADDEEPQKQAEEMTEAERVAALKEVNKLNERMVALFQQGKYTDAITMARQALEIRQKALGPAHADVAMSLTALARLLHTHGDYDQARPLYVRALEIFEKELGSEHTNVALGLNNLAGLLETMGAYDEARPLHERALEIREKALGNEHPLVAYSLNNLAMVLEVQGALGEARSLLERALMIFEKALGPEHPHVATSLNNLAQLLKTQGAYEKARQCYERSLRILESTFGNEHPHVARGLHNLGQLLATQGAYEEALHLYERGLRIREKLLGPMHPDVAVSLGGLAALLYWRGAYHQARPLAERALKISEAVLGPEHPDVASSLNSLAMLLEAVGASEDARPLYERALKIYEKAFGPEHHRVGTMLSNLAAFLDAQGAYEEARPLLERALQITEDALGAEHPDLALRLNNLASLLHAKGALDEARPLYERAVSIAEKALGPEHHHVAQSIGNLALLHAEQGNHEVAGRMLERCLQIVEGRMRGSLVDVMQTERLSLGRSLRYYLDGWLAVAPLLKRSGHAATLRFKGRFARMAAAERSVMRAAGEEVAERVSELRVAERSLARLANSAPSFRDKQKRAVWQRAYADAAAQREKLALALQRDFPPLRQGLERIHIALPDIQAQLAQDAVLLEFFRSDDVYIAWLVRPEGEPRRLELGDARKIEAATAAFTEAAADADDPGWREAGKALRALVFSPIAAHLSTNVKTIYVCPDAALAVVPFGALPGSEGRRPLIDEYVISMVSMAQDLVPWPVVSAPGTGALVVGGVDYGEAAVGEKEDRAETAPVARAPRGRNFRYLPGTKAEADTIQSSLGEGTKVLLDKTATENRLRIGTKGKRVLHLATHGFVREDLMGGLVRDRQDREWLGARMERQLARGHDPLLLAGLAMAGANSRKGGHGDDGILTALEASHLDLDGVELVVLSACETALGRAESGEGVIGLVQGFQTAGAKSVIGSLWRVSDEATKALMVKFYEFWSSEPGKGLDATEALRKAQAHLRTQPKWEHPYYWAPWLLWERR